MLTYLLDSTQEGPGHFLLVQSLPSFEPQPYVFVQACMKGEAWRRPVTMFLFPLEHFINRLARPKQHNLENFIACVNIISKDLFTYTISTHSYTAAVMTYDHVSSSPPFYFWRIISLEDLAKNAPNSGKKWRRSFRCIDSSCRKKNARMMSFRGVLKTLWTNHQQTFLYIYLATH